MSNKMNNKYQQKNKLDDEIFNYCSTIVFPKAFIKKYYNELTFVDWKYLMYLFENTISKNRLECFISNKIMKQFVSNDTYIKATRRKLSELGLVELKKISGGWLHRIRFEAIDERKKLEILISTFDQATNNYNTGKMLQAIELCNSGLGLAKELEDTERTAKFYNLLGQVYTVINQIDKAFECFSNGLKLLEARQPPELYFDITVRLSDLCFNRLELEQALSGYKIAFETIKIFAPKRDNDFVKIYCKLSISTFMQGQHSAGAMYLDRAQERLEDITDQKTKIFFSYINGYILFEILDELENGRVHVEKAWNDALEEKDFNFLYPIALLLLKIYREDKNISAANKVLDDITLLMRPNTKQEIKSRIEIEIAINKILENDIVEAKRRLGQVNEGISILGDKILLSLQSLFKSIIKLKETNDRSMLLTYVSNISDEFAILKKNHQYHNVLYVITKVKEILIAKNMEQEALNFVKDGYETAEQYYLNYYIVKFAPLEVDNSDNEAQV